jgi:hypothetical protein
MDAAQKQAYFTLAQKVDMGYQSDESEPFHRNDIVLAFNKRTGSSEPAKVVFAESAFQIARVMFQSRIDFDGRIIHMSDDIPYSEESELELSHKYDGNIGSHKLRHWQTPIQQPWSRD